MADELAGGQTDSVSINTRMDISGFQERKSLTSPLLTEYEVVRNEDHTETILRSYDNNTFNLTPGEIHVTTLLHTVIKYVSMIKRCWRKAEGGSDWGRFRWVGEGE